jgi:hypothetical protein
MPRKSKPAVSRRKTTPATGRTLLAHWRIKQGMTQVALAKAAGIPIVTYRRLERGQIKNPRVGWLTNCGWVLMIDPAILLSDYENWIPLRGGPRKPPDDPSALHREGRFPNVPEAARTARLRRQAGR